ncbi:uncharacterized protein J3R85_001082 [Psidium guajava]|nr:uncharacterized protein J3R85_001082 [Psidium guajava]
MSFLSSLGWSRSDIGVGYAVVATISNVPWMAHVEAENPSLLINKRTPKTVT